MSDSISIFSDLNDSVGTFLLEPVITNESSVVDSAKKIATPGKVPCTKSKLIKKSSPNNIVIAQKLTLPAELVQDGLVVKFMMPTCDGSYLILVVENTNPNANSTFAGAFVVYNVIVEANLVVLDRQNSKIRKIQKPEDMPVSVCLITSDFGENELCCVLPGGNVRIINLAEMSSTTSIQRTSVRNRITSASYSSSKFTITLPN